MNPLTDEQWGDIADYPMWSIDICWCWFEAQWMAKLLSAKHELKLLDETGCLDADLL